MSFARFALDRMPELAARLGKKDVALWLEAQDSLDMDGRRMWVLAGDRLADEAEAKLDWALRHKLVDEARLRALQSEYRGESSDTIAVDPSTNGSETNDD